MFTFGVSCLGLVVWSRLIGADWAVFLGMIRVDCLGLVLHLGLVVWGPLFGVSCLVFWDWWFEVGHLKLVGCLRMVGWLDRADWLVGWLRLVF